MGFPKLDYVSSAPDPWNNKFTHFDGNHDAKYWHGPIELEAGELLYSFVRGTKPEVVVETGTATGFSGLFLGCALRDNKFGKLYTIEFNTNLLARAKKRFEDENISQFVNAYQGNSEDFPEILHNLISKSTIPPFDTIDLLFLDADDGHDYKHTINEYNNFRNKFTIKMIILHDILSFPGPRQVFDEVKHDWKYSMILPTARGLGVLLNNE